MHISLQETQTDTSSPRLEPVQEDLISFYEQRGAPAKAQVLEESKMIFHLLQTMTRTGSSDGD